MPRPITPEDIRPEVRVANYLNVPKGSFWGVRTLNDYELILVARGHFAYEPTSGPPRLLGPGTVLCIPPAQPHTFRRVNPRGAAVISCLHCELVRGQRYLAGDYRPEPEPALVTRPQPLPPVHEVFRRCAAVFEGLSRYRAALLETLARQLWLLLAEHWTAAAGPGGSPRTRQMVRYVHDHLTEPISRRDLARAFGLTPGHVNALFQAELGLTPTQLLHRERVFLAQRLLKSEGLSVKETARRVGFCDEFYFSKLFKRIMGMPPSQA